MNIVPDDQVGPFTYVDRLSTTRTTADDTSTFIEVPTFRAYRKIPRLFRDVTITEKIDGTNAHVLITDDGRIYAGKRTGYITPKNDNFGFAAWVEEHKDELLKLGPGRHYGEWYGKGINRNYGLQDRRFALFNTEVSRDSLPSCVDVVPILYHGLFSTGVVRDCIIGLTQSGSVAVPGFLKPEGIVIYHEKAGQLFKVTCENDDVPKGV